MAAMDLLDTQVCSVARTTHHQGLSLAHLSNSQEHITQVTPHFHVSCLSVFGGYSDFLVVSTTMVRGVFVRFPSVDSRFGHSMKTLSF